MFIVNVIDMSKSWDFQLDPSRVDGGPEVETLAQSTQTFRQHWTEWKWQSYNENNVTNHSAQSTQSNLPVKLQCTVKTSMACSRIKSHSAQPIQTSNIAPSKPIKTRTVWTNFTPQSDWDKSERWSNVQESNEVSVEGFGALTKIPTRLVSFQIFQWVLKYFSEFSNFSVVFEPNSKSNLSAAWCLL